MIIRAIEIKDVKNFLELSKKIDESGEKTTTTEEQKNILKGILSEKRSIFFVAEIENKLVGFIEAIGSNLKRNQHCAYLVLGVLEDYQGQGVATALFNRVFEWAKEIEISRLELTIMTDNHKAFNLYRKMGFILEGEKVHSLMIDGESVNEYYLYQLINKTSKAPLKKGALLISNSIATSPQTSSYYNHLFASLLQERLALHFSALARVK